MTQQRLSVVTLALALVLGAGSRSHAQSADAGAPQIMVGSQVRIDVSGGTRVSGLVVSLEGESLGLAANGSVVAVPKAAIRTIDIRTGRRRHPVRGAMVGALTGIVGGFTQPLQEGDVCRPSVRYCTRSGAVTAGVVGGALVGAVIGSLVKTDVWTRATVTFVGAVGQGRSSVGLSASIGLPSQPGRR